MRYYQSSPQYQNKNKYSKKTSSSSMNSILNKLNNQHQHEHEDEDDEHSEGEHQSHSIIQAHGMVLTISWFVLLQLGIWSHYFRHYRYSILIHIACMSLIAILSVIGVVMMIIAEGRSVIWHSMYHQTIGFFIVVGLLPITLINGGIAKVLMSIYGVQTPWIVIMKQGHRIFGWLIVILVQIPLLTGWAEDGIGVAMFIILIDIGSYCLYWYLKLNRTKLEQIVLNTNYTILPADYHPISSLSQYMRSYSGQYFIFANYVYKLQPVIASHPGGQLVIDQIRNRETDQYLYGTAMIDKYDKKKVEPISHSSNCLQLAGNPYTKITIPQPFVQLDEVNKCTVFSIQSNQNQSMYVVYLKVELSDQFATGYTQVNQLGRYRALCVDNLTRLYSNVQFLRASNVRKMRLIMGVSQHEKYKRLTSPNKNSNMESKQIELEQKLMNGNEYKDEYIPLFIKKYQLGEFTSKLSNSLGIRTAILSQSRGFGLGLDHNDQKEGKQRMVLIASGTGLNPYCDLIDLLYKEMLINQKVQGWETMLTNYPILEGGLSKYYEFILYIAIDSLFYIHPITIYQCEQLSKNKLLQCHLKLKQKTSMTQLQYIQALPLTYRFKSIIQKQDKFDKNTKFRICGPPSLTYPIVSKMESLGIEGFRYRVL